MTLNRDVSGPLILRPILFIPKQDLYSKLEEQRFKGLVQRLARFSLVAKSEQEAQVNLVMIWVESMLCENLVICGEDGAKGEVVNIGGLLRGGNDLVQNFDVCGPG